MTPRADRPKALHIVASLRSAGTWWLAATLVLIWAVAGLHLAEERAHALAGARSNGMNLARAFSEAAMRTVLEVDQTLKLARSIDAAAGTEGNLAALIEPLLPNRTLARQVSFVDGDGVVRLANLQPLTGHIVVAERPYFRRFAEHPVDALEISQPKLDRVSGQRVVTFARPRLSPTGVFGGVVTLALRPEALLSFARPVDLGARGDISLTGLDGFLRAGITGGSPVIPADQVRPDPVVGLAAEAVEGSYTWTSPLDHVTRLYSFRRLSGLPLVISTGLQRDSVLAEYTHDLPRLLGAAGGASLLLVGLAVAGNRTQRERAGLQTVLERTLGAISQGVLMADPRGRVMVINRRTRELLELPATVGIGSTIQDLIADPCDGGDGAGGAMLGWPGEQNECRQTRPNGTVLERRSHRLGDGSIVRTTTDVTDWERAQRALRDARDAAEAAIRARTQFLAVMSHEIRTPLNGVLGVAELLGDGSLTPEQRACVQTIGASGRHLLALLNDVLDFTRIDSGALTLEHVAFDPRTVLEAVRAMMVPEVEERGLTMLAEVTPAVPPRVIGDPQRLRQVLAHLLGNALKFTTAGEVTVRLDATKVEAGWRLDGEVRDSGIGIDAVTLAHLFEEQTRADGSGTRRVGDSGLGLMISRRLLEAMGGGITAESQPGRGSTFRFSLNVAAATPQAAVTGTAPPPLRVLLAEDNTVNRLVATRFVERLGHTVRPVADGAEAVAAASGGDFDLVLMDLMMPRMDGLAATRAIRRLPGPPGQVKIIGITASASRENESACRHAGMDGFAPKPITLERLACEITRVCGTHAAVLPSHASPKPPPIDRSALEALRDTLGAPALAEIVAAFRADAPPRLARMRGHAAEGSGQRLAREAHALTGSAAALGLHRLAAAARALEQQAPTDAGGLTELVAGVESEFEPALAALKSWAA